MGGSQHSSVTAVGIATFQTMHFPRTPLLCGLEPFLLVWNNKAACFLYSFLHCLSFTSALGAVVWLPGLTAVLSVLHRRALAGIGQM